MKFLSEFFKQGRFLLEYGVIVIFNLLLRPLPRCGLTVIAALAGRGMYYLIPSFRRLVLANLRAAMPEKPEDQIRRIGRESLVNLSRTMLEFFWFSNAPGRIARYVHISPESRVMIDRHIAAGENIIFVTPHLGNWEATGLKMAQDSGLDFAVVVRPPRNPYINRLIRKNRSSNGNDIIEAKGAVRQMIRAVRHGKSMATLIDQNTRVRDGGVFVEFFGLPVPSSRAPAMFGKMDKVRIYVGGGIRQPNGDIVTFHEPLPKPQHEYRDDAELIQDLMRITESYVRRYPEQYLWFYRRFQYIPREAEESLRRKYPFYATTAPEKFYFKKK